MMQQNGLILKNFVDNISSRGQFLSNKIKFLSFTTIKGKLAHYLLELAKKEQRDHFMMPHSQSQLAELFGVTRPSIGRAIGELNREGIIQTDGKQVMLMNRDKLSQLLL
jgi:CRP-like cAMP-binding protein